MATTTTVGVPTDNLNPPPAPSRVFYSLGRMLGVDDFQADQDYHRGCLARALLQLCGTGTVAGLNVSIPQVWQPNTQYPASAFVYDSSQNVQVNTGVAGLSGSTRPTFATSPGGTATDANGIVWTNEGPVNTNGWRPNAPFASPSAIIDSNNNIQILIGAATFTAGPLSPVWSTAIGSTTLDGNPAVPAWTCVGPAQLQIEVTPGMAVDRVGRLIEVPSTVCIRIQPWLANQALADLNSFLSGGTGNILIDVFATYVACSSGVTPCFATQDDYSATDAFSSNRMLDSFAMQLVLRNDSSPGLPKDPWDPTGAVPTGAITSAIAQSLKQNILAANAGPASTPPFAATGPTPAEIPPGFDASSVFLARVTIPATAGASGEPPNFNLNNITIDNLSRLFLYPASLVARSIGLSSGS
ncbi:MAG: hypothetical protein ABSB60_10900 [Terracidiphilus sp.]|jgi:hypothetical protein